jgi:hypothetical protein
VNEQRAPKKSWLSEQFQRGNYSATALVLAFIIAIAPTQMASYPLYMSILVLAGSGWALFVAVRKRVLWAVVFVAYAFTWSLPLLGVQFFAEQVALGFVIHAICALSFGLAGYTFLASPKPTRRK